MWDEVWEHARAEYRFDDIVETLMPMNIYDGNTRMRGSPFNYYDRMIPKLRLIAGGEIVVEIPLQAQIPALKGQWVKEAGLQVYHVANLTWLSGRPVEDEEEINAPCITIENGESERPGDIVIQCQRMRRLRLRGKQNPANGYRPYRNSKPQWLLIMSGQDV